MSDYQLPKEVDSELKRLKKKEKLYSSILISVIGFFAVAAIAGYLTKESFARTNDFYGTGYPSYDRQASYTGSSGGWAVDGYGGASGGCGSSGGGCGSSGFSGGCGGCGGSGGAAIDVDFGELERQALESYQQENGTDTTVTAKVQDYGCHIQVDIYNAENKIVKSYGYRGDSLYVIR